jgi:hypothetical protein
MVELFYREKEQALCEQIDADIGKRGRCRGVVVNLCLISLFLPNFFFPKLMYIHTYASFLIKIQREAATLGNEW